MGIVQKAQAYEFKRFKLQAHLEHKRKLKSGLLRASRDATGKENNLQMPPLFAEIEALLVESYEKIGKDQANKLLKNYNLGRGVLNFSGFTWFKSLSNYDLKVNRELAPDLMSSKWIVQDSFSIIIKATTLISNLQQQKLLSIKPADLKAFAGMNFKRTYRYHHFADSYKQGLTSNFAKLFMTFKKMHLNSINGLADYEVLKRLDEYSFNAGGKLNLSVDGTTTISAGTLVKKFYKSSVMLQRLGPEDNDEEHHLRISLENETFKSTQIEIQVQHDFFHLLRLSLLEYELQYRFGENRTTYLNLSNKDLKHIADSPRQQTELSGLIKGRGQIDLLSHLITTYEKRTQENMSSKFSFLLFGSMKKRATEQIHIIKNGIEKTFFSATSESLSYVESFFSKLFQSVIFRLFNFPTDHKKRMSTRKVLSIEYEKIKNLPPTSVKDETQFSIKFSHELEIAKTHKWYHRRFLKTALTHLKNMSNLPASLIESVKNKHLKAPMVVKTHILLDDSHFIFFNQLPVKKISTAIQRVCNFSKAKRSTRRGKIKRGSSKQQRCYKTLMARLEDYKNVLVLNKIIDLFKFKKFIGLYLSKAKAIEDLTHLFGTKNFFYHGKFTAMTKDGKDFQTFFKSGQFKGHGVIDRFKNGDVKGIP